MSLSSAAVVTPGLTCVDQQVERLGVRRPALRIPAKASGPCSLIWPLRRPCSGGIDERHAWASVPSDRRAFAFLRYLSRRAACAIGKRLEARSGDLANAPASAARQARSGWRADTGDPRVPSASARCSSDSCRSCAVRRHRASGLLALTWACAACSVRPAGQAHRLPAARRRRRSLRGRPVDVVSLGARMRLYPHNNVAEKRLLFTPQYFDPPRARAARRAAQGRLRLPRRRRQRRRLRALDAAARRARGRASSRSSRCRRLRAPAYNIRQSDFANVKAVSLRAAPTSTARSTLFVNTQNQGETSVRIVSAEAQVEQIARARQDAAHAGARGGLCEDRRDQARHRRRRRPGARSLPRARRRARCGRASIIMEFSLLRRRAQLEQRLRGLGYRRNSAHRRERRL